jgi:hypothetical protein
MTRGKWGFCEENQDVQKTNMLDGRRKQPLFEKSGAKTFYYAGPWALSAPTPMAQVSKVFLLLFVHKK